MANATASKPTETATEAAKARKQKESNYTSFRLNVRFHNDVKIPDDFIAKLLGSFADESGNKLRTRNGRKSGVVTSYTIDTPDSYDKAMNQAANQNPEQQAEKAASKLVDLAKQLNMTVDELIAKVSKS